MDGAMGAQGWGSPGVPKASLASRTGGSSGVPWGFPRSYVAPVAAKQGGQEVKEARLRALSFFGCQEPTAQGAGLARPALCLWGLASSAPGVATGVMDEAS